jgi:hypothetical protein
VLPQRGHTCVALAHQLGPSSCNGSPRLVFRHGVATGAHERRALAVHFEEPHRVFLFLESTAGYCGLGPCRPRLSGVGLQNLIQARNLCGTMLSGEEHGAATASWAAVVDDMRRAGTHSTTGVAVP